MEINWEIKIMEQFLVQHKIWLEVMTAVGALAFGVWQIKINTRLKSLQDYVAIAAVPEPKEGKIKLLNTGKVNLYLWGFDMLGNNQRFQKPRLITAGTGDTAYYWIDPPPNIDKIGSFPYEFKFKLYLEDDFKKKWISEHGGQAEKIKIDGKDAVKIIIWSHKTYKKKWFFNNSTISKL